MAEPVRLFEVFEDMKIVCVRERAFSNETRSVYFRWNCGVIADSFIIQLWQWAWYFHFNFETNKLGRLIKKFLFLKS